MWRCEPDHLKPLMSDGRRFAQLVDRLIRASAARHHVNQSDIQTQLRENITDGGVDTAVHTTIPCETGWFDVPTCWQYKARPAVDINDSTKNARTLNELQKEINGDHVVELIKKGYGYRLCILGDMPDKKAVANWEEQLRIEQEKINKAAPPPKVVHGGFLPNWIEMFPAVIHWLMPPHASVFHLESWQNNCQAVTGTYVENPEWKITKDRIQSHLKFDQSPSKPCLSIGGAAGVGKTRLVCEAVLELKEGKSLVVYAADELEAKSIAVELANYDTNAWLIADECSETVKYFLQENLKGAISRVRVVCINNVRSTHQSTESEVWLEPSENLEAILVANFAHIPRDSCRRYADLSKGFVRLAADMCQHHEQIENGDFGELLSGVEDYVRNRLSEKWLPAVSLIALFPKIGFSGEVQSEIESLATISNISVQEFKDMVREVKESPGFVVQQGRYWYVSPHIISQTLYKEGWDRWVGEDHEAFLHGLPPSLIQPFLDRAKDVGGEGVRAQLGDSFQLWAAKLTITDLQNPRICAFFRALIETKVEDYLPILQRLLAQATDEENEAIGGLSTRELTSSRRTLVWLLESLVAFPEYFEDCEDCLFGLARGENEQQISNNATEIWAELFSVVLSGSAAPFDDRFSRLESRIETGVRLDLCLVALLQVIRGQHSKVEGPPMIAGRLRPKSWRPETQIEINACLERAISVLKILLSSDDPDVRQGTVDVIAKCMYVFVNRDLVNELRASFDTSNLDEKQRRQLIHALEKRLEEKDESEEDGDWVKQVSDWIQSLQPTDFEGRFRNEVSRERWDIRGEELEMLEALTAELVSTEDLFNSQLDWLFSKEARSAQAIGVLVGRLDSENRFGLIIANRAMSGDSAAMLRGYINGISALENGFAEGFVTKIDELQQHNPAVCVDVIVFGGVALNALQRTLDMVAGKQVSAHTLVTYTHGYAGRQLDDAEVESCLSVMIERHVESRDDSIGAAVKFVSYLVHKNEREKAKYLSSSELKELAWKVVDFGSEAPRQKDAWELGRIVDWLGRHDGARASATWSKWLVSESFDLNSAAKERIATHAELNPENAMSAFGSALLDTKHGVRLQISNAKEVIGKLPVSVVKNWVQEHGEEGARVLARQLPAPYYTEDNQIVVPETTSAVLELFPTDDVISSFAASTMSGSWWGNAADRFRREAELAKKLLTHENEGIRKWAEYEYESKKCMAEREDQEHEERDLPG